MNAIRILSGAVAALALPAFAQTNALLLDPAQTRIEFSLADVLHTVHGTFQLKSGAIQFDPVTGAAGGAVVVDAASGDSGSKARDSRMNEKFLESGKYPEITFTPTHVDGPVAETGDSQVQVHGLFGLHGAQHEITVPAQIHISGDRLSATLHFVVPYVAWGIKNPSTFLLRVSDKVRIDLQATARLLPRIESKNGMSRQNSELAANDASERERRRNGTADQRR